MRVSLSSLYAARITAKQSRVGCYLRGVAGHTCSPLCQWIPYLRDNLKIGYTNNTHVSAMLCHPVFDALVLPLSSRTARRALEAIDLVLLAAQLDPVHTWEIVIRIGCGVENYLPSLIKPTEIVPRLRLLPHSERALSKWLRWLRMPWLRSPRYWLTRKWLLNEHRDAYCHSEQSMQKIPVLMEWAFKLTRRRLPESMTSQLAARGQAEHARFQVIEITNYVSGFSLHRLADQRLQEQEGYQITDVFNCSFTEDELLRLHDAGIHIRFSSIYGWTAAGLASMTFVRGDLANPAEVFKFGGDISYLPNGWWFMVREAGGVKEVSLKLILSMRDQQRTIAAALLHPRSPTSVEHVHLRGVINNESFSDMLQVLQSEDPFEQLGWGQLTDSRYRPTSRSHLRSLRLELHVSIAQDDSLLFFEVLRIVGFGLETLAIESINDWLRPDEDDLVVLFTACPKLQCLSLINVSLASLRPLVNAYDAGLCPSLATFIHTGRIDDAESIASLLEACNDPYQHVHHTLRDVALKDHRKYPEPVLQRIFNAIRHNRTLRHIALDLQDGLYTAKQRRELLRISQTPVLVPLGKLPLAHKLAFLSAVGSLLDQDACRRVLEFTSVMELRRIVCEEGRRHLDW